MIVIMRSYKYILSLMILFFYLFSPPFAMANEQYNKVVCGNISEYASAWSQIIHGSSITIYGDREYIASLINSLGRFVRDERNESAANILIDNIPSPNQYNKDIVYIQSLLCDNETIDNYKILEDMFNKMPKIFSIAAIISNRPLGAYLTYIIKTSRSVADAENVYSARKYIVNLCGVRHRDFVAGLNSIQVDDRIWFSKNVILVNKCQFILKTESY